MDTKITTIVPTKAVETKAAEIKAPEIKTAEKPAEVKAPAAAKKAGAPKKAGTTKKAGASKKAGTTKKAGTSKKAGTTKKTAAEKKAATGETVYVQFGSTEANIATLVDAAKAAFKAEKSRTAIKDLKLYVKPEESAAYYVVNGEFTGKVGF